MSVLYRHNLVVSASISTQNLHTRFLEAQVLVNKQVFWYVSNEMQ